MTRGQIICVIGAQPGITAADVAAHFTQAGLPPPDAPYSLCDEAGFVVLEVEGTADV